MRRSFVFLVWQWIDLLSKHPMYNSGLKLDTLNFNCFVTFLKNSIYDFFSMPEFKKIIKVPNWYENLYKVFKDRNPYKLNTKSYDEYSIYLQKKLYKFSAPISKFYEKMKT